MKNALYIQFRQREGVSLQIFYKYLIKKYRIRIEEKMGIRYTKKSKDSPQP